jgi:hypothetical protein
VSARLKSGAFQNIVQLVELGLFLFELCALRSQFLLELDFFGLQFLLGGILGL